MQGRTVAALLAGTVALAACGGGEGGATREPAMVEDTAAGAAGAAATTTAALRNGAGKELGTLTLTEGGGGVTVAGDLSGLPPGEHAIHLHAVGQCQAPSFESAGDHWNPTNAQHGSESPKGPHFGDLPNLTVGSDSSVTVQATTSGGTIRGENALLDADGAAVVIHSGKDDYRSQPSGDAGDRLACGEVTGG